MLDEIEDYLVSWQLELTKSQVRIVLGTGLWTELIEDVIVALVLSLKNDTRLFEQIGLHAGADYVMRAVEIDLYELAEARRVVVSSGFRVTERLHYRVRREHFLLDLCLFRWAAHVGEVTHRVFRRYCFASAWFAAYYNRLVLLEA